jgi:spore maturation protein B
MSHTTLIWVDFFNNWIILVIIGAMLGFAWLRGVKVYQEFVVGAKEGFDVGVMIIPYLVAILCAIGLFTASGAMKVIERILAPATGLIGMDPALLPLALTRPLTGSGARGVMFDIWIEHGGPDSLLGLTASVMQGSTETTFYVIAVYCGAVGVRKIRYALGACLVADLAGIIAAVMVCNWFFGPMFR